MSRIDERKPDELRPLEFKPDFLAHPASSVLIVQGGTKVVCALSHEAKVPPWMRAQKVSGGWLTAEYGLLPASTGERCKREASSGKQGGRTMEIQRLIGRSLRASVDLEKLGENTLTLDCDVIDADGGTRCASITGADLALEIAFRRGMLPKDAFRLPVAAISVGIVNGAALLDLNYEEDSHAEVDMNVIMTGDGNLIEVQGTAEGAPFSRARLNELVDLAEHGLKQIFEKRAALLEKICSDKKTTAPRTGGKLNTLGDAFAGLNL